MRTQCVSQDIRKTLDDIQQKIQSAKETLKISKEKLLSPIISARRFTHGGHIVSREVERKNANNNTRINKEQRLNNNHLTGHYNERAGSNKTNIDKESHPFYITITKGLIEDYINSDDESDTIYQSKKLRKTSTPKLTLSPVCKYKNCCNLRNLRNNIQDNVISEENKTKHKFTSNNKPFDSMPCTPKRVSFNSNKSTPEFRRYKDQKRAAVELITPKPNPKPQASKIPIKQSSSNVEPLLVQKIVVKREDEFYLPRSDLERSIKRQKKKKKPITFDRRKYETDKHLKAASRLELYRFKIRGRSVNSRLTFCPMKIYKLGERGSGLRSRGAVQDFYRLRDYHLRNGTLFEDPDFPPVNSSLYYSKSPGRNFEWKRPKEIVDNPKLFVEGYSRFDVQQGELGDCWLLAAVANLTLYRRLFFQVVPDDQSFEDDYAGIFHFRFWQYGRWIDVVIDDRLPTYRGQLIFLHSTEDNEFWSALLEKAYAKLHGSYEALKGGSTCEAMEDFTGGVTEMYEMNATPPNLFKIILKAYERSSLMGCSLEPDPEVLEAETAEGLIRGHAYSITRVKYVNISTPNASGKIPLLRLRNPWGNESEWNGAWSDKSPEWRFIPEQEKRELGLTFDDDGEFWMSFNDFQKHFDRLEICNLNPDSLTEDEMAEGNKKQWEMSVFEGEWVRGVTAGGCRNNLDTFWHNPQYRITLTDPDEGDDDNKCTVIVALMQKNRRSQRNMGIDVLTIGFAIYHLPYPDRAPKPLNLNFFKYNASVARSPSFINLREVSCRFKLPPGTYCIVPSTFDPNEEGEFLLRVFSENKNNMEENDDQVGFGEVTEKHSKKKARAAVKSAPTPEEEKETDKVKDFFLQLAGEDEEVDWQELKQILDYAMRQEKPLNKESINGLNAAPGENQGTEGDNLLMTLLGLICGALCKNTPLADIVPENETHSQILTSSHETRDKGISKDICRSMVAMLDVDRSGKLGYEEFKKLWIDLKNWKNVFKLHDIDNSGALSGYELRNALNESGYHVNNHVLNILMHRYGNKRNEIEFDDFLMCAVKLKSMIEKFKDHEQDDDGNVSFSLEEWIELTLYS